jgi:hypothetical protein
LKGARPPQRSSRRVHSERQALLRHADRRIEAACWTQRLGIVLRILVCFPSRAPLVLSAHPDSVVRGVGRHVAGKAGRPSLRGLRQRALAWRACKIPTRQGAGAGKTNLIIAIISFSSVGVLRIFRIELNGDVLNSPSSPLTAAPESSKRWSKKSVPLSITLLGIALAVEVV